MARLEVFVNRGPGSFSPPMVCVDARSEQWFPVPTLPVMAPAWIVLVEAIRLHPPVRAAIERAVEAGIDLARLNAGEFSPSLALVAADLKR